jgi:hypothetical protein
MQDFEGNCAIVLRILREVDGRHASAAQLSINGINAAKRNFEAINWERSQIPVPVSRRVNMGGVMCAVKARHCPSHSPLQR